MTIKNMNLKANKSCYVQYISFYSSEQECSIWYGCKQFRITKLWMQVPLPVFLSIILLMLVAYFLKLGYSSFQGRDCQCFSLYNIVRHLQNALMIIYDTRVSIMMFWFLCTSPSSALSYDLFQLKVMKVVCVQGYSLVLSLLTSIGTDMFSFFPLGASNVVIVQWSLIFLML